MFRWLMFFATENTWHRGICLPLYRLHKLCESLSPSHLRHANTRNFISRGGAENAKTHALHLCLPQVRKHSASRQARAQQRVISVISYRIVLIKSVKILCDTKRTSRNFFLSTDSTEFRHVLQVATLLLPSGWQTRVYDALSV